MHRLTATDTPMVRYTRTIFPSYADLLIVADCNYHVFFKTDISDISGLPYEEIGKEQLKDYLDMTVLRVDQEWNITIG